jgi:hypothetical protein
MVKLEVRVIVNYEKPTGEVYVDVAMMDMSRYGDELPMDFEFWITENDCSTETWHNLLQFNTETR